MPPTLQAESDGESLGNMDTGTGANSTNSEDEAGDSSGAGGSGRVGGSDGGGGSTDDTDPDDAAKADAHMAYLMFHDTLFASKHIKKAAREKFEYYCSTYPEWMAEFKAEVGLGVIRLRCPLAFHISARTLPHGPWPPPPPHVHTLSIPPTPPPPHPPTHRITGHKPGPRERPTSAKASPRLALFPPVSLARPQWRGTWRLRTDGLARGRSRKQHGQRRQQQRRAAWSLQREGPAQGRSRKQHRQRRQQQHV